MNWDKIWNTVQHIGIAIGGAVALSLGNYVTTGGSLTDGHGIEAAALGGVVGLIISYMKKLQNQNTDQQAQLDAHNQALTDAKILPPK